jgi:Family of unknown function (DUF5681)
MKSITRKSDSSQPAAETAVYLFDDWFDPIETGVRRANPRGRGKRKIPTEAEIIRNVLNFPAEFSERGKSKRAPRVEIMIKRFGAPALKGDPGAAALLLEMRARLEKHGDINPIRITMTERDMKAA